MKHAEFDYDAVLTSSRARAIYAFEPEWIVYDDRQVQVLQMAMIKHRYIDGQGASPDWSRILDLVTRPTQHSLAR